MVNANNNDNTEVEIYTINLISVGVVALVSMLIARYGFGTTNEFASNLAWVIFWCGGFFPTVITIMMRILIHKQ